MTARLLTKDEAREYCGGMFNTPRGWPMLCRDLRQALDERGLQHIKQRGEQP